MAWTQSDSDIFHTRLMHVATGLLDLDEEIERLLSLAASEDLATNLTDASDDSVTKAEAVALNGVVQSLRAWFAGTATSVDANRRQKLDAYLVRARSGSTIP